MAYLFQLRSAKTMASLFQRNLILDHEMMLKYVTIQRDNSIRSICSKSPDVKDKSEKLEIESKVDEDTYEYDNMKNKYGGVAMTLKKGNWVPPPYPDLLMKLHVPDVNCFSPQFKAIIARGIKLGEIDPNTATIKQLEEYAKSISSEIDDSSMVADKDGVA
ncbi:hypothetical protein Lser_V15G02244 [Lactuca serriola]